MSMEPFDYLTYKKNKQENLQNNPDVKDKKFVTIICVTTFLVFFLAVLFFAGSHTATVDIEKSNPKSSKIAFENDENEEEIRNEKFTIDKRLFVLHQEEKGPSKSKVIETQNSSEVISKDEFNLIKTNSIEVNQNIERQAPEQTSSATKPAGTTSQAAEAQAQKIAMKPKLPVKPEVKPIGAIEPIAASSKVLIGKYETVESARKIQAALSESIQDATPFVKRVNNYYSIQIGSFESFDTAKAVAGRLRAKGYDAWILH